MKRILSLISVIMLSPVAAEDCTNADTLMSTARWAYDQENKTLRLCIEDGIQLKCTMFPKQVFLDDGSFGYTENPFRND
jgi:hypothetical protein